MKHKLKGVLSKEVSAGTQHPGTYSAPRHPVGTFSTCSVFHYEHLRHLQHLQHLQPLFHYLNCFSRHLAVQFKEQNLVIKFYREVLRKAIKIVEKWLKVPEVIIVKHATGAEGAAVLSRCRGARVLGASTFPLGVEVYRVEIWIPTDRDRLHSSNSPPPPTIIDFRGQVYWVYL